MVGSDDGQATPMVRTTAVTANQTAWLTSCLPRAQLVVFGGIASVNNQQHFPKNLFLFDLGSFIVIVSPGLVGQLPNADCCV